MLWTPAAECVQYREFRDGWNHLAFREPDVTMGWSWHATTKWLDTGEKEKEKNILLFFLLFVEEDSFLPLEQRVELRIDLAGTTTLWKNQDVT